MRYTRVGVSLSVWGIVKLDAVQLVASFDDQVRITGFPVGTYTVSDAVRRTVGAGLVMVTDFDTQADDAPCESCDRA